MTLTHFNPFKDIDDFFGRTRQPQYGDIFSQDMTRSDWVPAVDVTESNDEFLITVEIPQVAKEDVHVEIQNHMLNIKGERKYENEDKKAPRIERFYGSFQRSFKLPENVQENKIHADQKDGMLYVNLPKTEVEQSKRLEIKIH
jgi:HSP20 family protein